MQFAEEREENIISEKAIEEEECKLRCFLEWFEAGGAILPSIHIRTEQGLRGVYACKKIRKGELTAHIPRDLIISLELAKRSPIGRQLEKLGSSIQPWVYFAAFMLQNQRENGFWKPYIDTMPNEFSGLRIHYQASLMAKLQGCYIQSRVNYYEFKIDLIRQYNYLKTYISSLSMREFMLMVSAVRTRVFKIRADGEESMGMVPLADMLNHSTSAQTRWSENITDGFSLTAVCDIDKDGEVFDSYGDKCNSILLVGHGFCIENNPHNLVEIDLPQIKRSHPFFHQIRELGEPRGKHHTFQVPIDYANSRSRRMFSYLRLACLGDISAIENALHSTNDFKTIPAISIRNELTALSALALACKRCLDRYPTTLKEDTDELAKQNLQWSMRCAVMIGHGEKHILHHYLELTRIAIEALSSPLDSLMQVTSLESKPGHPFASYFRFLAKDILH